jgi:creatinine amidohydrolase/Fe(II)-dependent formamide hydrolase-like protein
MTAATRRMDLMAVHEIEETLKTTDIAIVPVGAIEPHGRHAPMGSDTFIALEIAERLAAACGGLVFPPIPFGNVNLGYDFRYMPGTISLDSKLLIDLHRNIGTELARSGIRRIVFVNGHAPNTSILNIAAFEIRDEAGVEVGILEWWTCAPTVIEDIKGFNFASHGDEIETSLVMATDGRDYVDLSRADVNSRTLEQITPEELALYKAKVPFTRTLDKRWIGRSGNMGDPTRATAAHGERIIARTIEVGLELLTVLAQQHEHRRLRQTAKEQQHGK